MNGPHKGIAWCDDAWKAVAGCEAARVTVPESAALFGPPPAGLK